MPRMRGVTPKSGSKEPTRGEHLANCLGQRLRRFGNRKQGGSFQLIGFSNQLVGKESAFLKISNNVQKSRSRFVSCKTGLIATFAGDTVDGSSSRFIRRDGRAVAMGQAFESQTSNFKSSAVPSVRPLFA